MLFIILLSRVTPFVDEIVWGVISMDFNVTYQLLVVYSVFMSCWRKKTVIQLGFEKACASCKKEVFYNILTECDILFKIVRLTFRHHASYI